MFQCIAKLLVKQFFEIFWKHSIIFVLHCFSIYQVLKLIFKNLFQYFFCKDFNLIKTRAKFLRKHKTNKLWKKQKKGVSQETKKHKHTIEDQMVNVLLKGHCTNMTVSSIDDWLPNIQISVCLFIFINSYFPPLHFEMWCILFFTSPHLQKTLNETWNACQSLLIKRIFSLFMLFSLVIVKKFLTNHIKSRHIYIE